MNVRSQFVAVAFALTLGLMSCSTAESDSNDSTAATQTETDSTEKEIQGTYVLQGPEVYRTLWAELSTNFGTANVVEIMKLNELDASMNEAGRVIQIPEGIEVPE